uniref:Uncharacterized protein n=1 Tax=Mycena chlorophos TaxID=658473 RepID=A0ABQ0LI93_MYCCL|nr:predicted protein [Mycena chlorophos]
MEGSPSELAGIGSHRRRESDGNSTQGHEAEHEAASLDFVGKSTDSWNSSNQDLNDTLDYEWKPDQILFLRRTLDALPPHLFTPFNGPIPPSNLLDKIARGVAQAKGEDWPHSMRATRTKLIEVARTMADEDSKLHQSIPEEDASQYPTGDVLQPTTNIDQGGAGLGPRRPLYRQSSMDFLNASDSQRDESISRLSRRLQKADRFIPNPNHTNYHPYSRSQIHRRSSSPPKPNDVPSLINPSTPSSSTLSSLASLSAASHPRTLRRSMSITSSSTASSSRMSLGSVGSLPPIDDPRVTRIRRSESFCGPQMEPRRSVKRAPSYGVMAAAVEIDLTPSSDEEEKDRTRRAKKQRVRNDSAATPPLSPSPVSSPATSPVTKTRATAGALKRKTPASVKAPESASAVPSKSTRKRSPGLFGAELPLASSSASSQDPAPTTPILSPAPLLLSAAAPAPEKVKTLRRVRRLPAARRISFGSLIPPVGEEAPDADMESNAEHALGSAFQLR